MNVLLANAYFYPLDAKQWRAAMPYPPLATITAAALLRQQGHTVSLFDTCLRHNPDEILPVLQRVQPGCFVIYDDGFNYLTKMCLTVMREAAFRMTTLAKQAGCTVIVSSSDATDHDEKYFDHGADYVIHGEGELTLSELLTALAPGGNPEAVPGLSYRFEGQRYKTSPRAVLRELDQLPMAAWDLVDIDAYRNVWKRNHGYFSLNLATTRGCPFKCNWCAKPIYGNRYNSRGPQAVADEIAYLLQHYQPDHFWMCDDIFGLKPGWIRQFSDAVKARGLSFRFKIQSRADLLVEPGVVQALADAGAETVWIGAESGSQQVLDAMDKGTTVGQIGEAAGMLRAAGIRSGFFLQFGYPGEQRADIDTTIHMIKELRPDEIGISVSYPLPGTLFHERVRAELKTKQNWADSDDLLLMYRSTFAPAFYKVLHRYVHSRYRLIRFFHGKPVKPIHATLSAGYHALSLIWNGMRLEYLSRRTPAPDQSQRVGEAFSRQSATFVQEDEANPVLQQWRQRIYRHVHLQLKPAQKILELNAGPGIDAMYFARHGHRVHATDLASGMIAQLAQNTAANGLSSSVTHQQVSYEQLNQVAGRYDYVFSNFGGLNCTADLRLITRHLPGLMNAGGYITWVIMPRMSLWELSWMLKGQWRKARRRWRQHADAHLEGVHFDVHYFSFKEIQAAFGAEFRLVRCEGLGVVSPPPAASVFLRRFPRLSAWLEKLDVRCGSWWPLRHWGDHVIITFQYAPAVRHADR